MCFVTNAHDYFYFENCQFEAYVYSGGRLKQPEFLSLTFSQKFSLPHITRLPPSFENMVKTCWKNKYWEQFLVKYHSDGLHSVDTADPARPLLNLFSLCLGARLVDIRISFCVHRS